MMGHGLKPIENLTSKNPKIQFLKTWNTLVFMSSTLYTTGGDPKHSLGLLKSLQKARVTKERLALESEEGKHKTYKEDTSYSTQFYKGEQLIENALKYEKGRIPNTISGATIASSTVSWKALAIAFRDSV